MIRIEPGKFYVTGHGELVGPMVEIERRGPFKFEANGTLYREHGQDGYTPRKTWIKSEFFVPEKVINQSEIAIESVKVAMLALELALKDLTSARQ